jgi:hypothetical protein
MGKYAGLGAHLRTQSSSEVPMTFSQIEAVTGTPLPPKAQHQRAWWSNNPDNNVMTKVWLDAGFETAQVDVSGRKLVFRRVRPRGMADEAREYKHEELSETPKASRRSPLFGCMKGTFWIDPDWDLTKPTMSEEELDEMEANLHRTADLIDAGMSKKAR